MACFFYVFYQISEAFSVLSFYDRNVGTAPAYSMKGRYDRGRRSENPGPG